MTPTDNETFTEVLARCQAYDWCQRTDLKVISYGDGKPYQRCGVGHVWPKPPPPDIAALDAEEDP